MERKIEVELNNRRYRIPEHMLEDAEKLGASTIKKTIKNPPKELKITGSIDQSDLEKENEALKAQIKKLSVDPTVVDAILPKMQSEIDIVKNKLTSLGIKFHPKTGLDKLKEKLKEAEDERAQE